MGLGGHSAKTAGEQESRSMHRTILITHRRVRSSTAGPKSSDVEI